MTTKDLEKFTPEQKRIKIAKACGWTHDASKDYDSFIGPDGHYKGGATHDLPRALENAGAPDYLNDLNAMRPVELSLSKDDYSRFRFNLIGVVHLAWCEAQVKTSDAIHEEPEYSIISATAAQRADAFLLTVG